MVQEDGRLVAGDLVIDSERHQVTIAGEPIELTPKEFDLLKTLAENTGKALERDFLLEKVWGYAFAGATRTLTSISAVSDKRSTMILKIRATLKPFTV